MSASPQLRPADYNQGHPATLPLDPSLTPSEPRPFVDPASFTSSPGLTPGEVEHFKREGFIVKRGLVRDDAAFEAVSNFIWSNVPRDLMQADDVTSWIDPPEEAWTEADALRVGLLARHNWKMRSSGRLGIGTEDFLVERIAQHPDLMKVVEALIGAPAMRPRRVRGVYCVFPAGPATAEHVSPHTDYMAAHLSAMVIADDIAPRGGGFMVWPGSHTRLHGFWRTVHGSAMATDKGPAFLAAREAALREIEPVEFTGARGDVVLWHPRLLHSAGVNRSADSGKPQVRVIIPCDYQRERPDYFDDDQFGPGEAYQWWIDTRNFASDVPPTPENMWDDWGLRSD